MTAEQLTEAIQDLPWIGPGKKALDIFNKAKVGKLSSPAGWFKEPFRRK